MTDKPKKWEWEEWEMETEVPPLGDIPYEVRSWERRNCKRSFHANREYMEWLEQELENWKITAISNQKMAAISGYISDKNRCLEQENEKLRTAFCDAFKMAEYYRSDDDVYFNDVDDVNYKKYSASEFTSRYEKLKGEINEN